MNVLFVCTANGGGSVIAERLLRREGDGRHVARMGIAGFTIGKLIGLPYAQTASMGFAVGSNDFELSIAVAVFGATSG